MLMNACRMMPVCWIPSIGCFSGATTWTSISRACNAAAQPPPPDADRKAGHKFALDRPFASQLPCSRHFTIPD
jgi:hypothetical protein